VFLDFPKICTAARRENFRQICSFLLWQIASPPTSQNCEKKETSHYLPWVCTLHNSRFSSEEAFDRRCFAGGLIQRFWEPRFHGARSRSGCFYWDWGFQEEEEPALCMPRVWFPDKRLWNKLNAHANIFFFRCVEGVRKDVVQIGIVLNCRQQVLAVLGDAAAVIRVMNGSRF
jgi:hypothetical protein